MKYEATVLRPDGRAERVLLTWDLCVAVGYAGRNQKAVRDHIDELVKVGVPAPCAVPAMYWIEPGRVFSGERLSVVGESSSGEVEFFMARDEGGDLFMTLASDHTDRALETVSVSKAKQACSKVLAPIFWKVSDVREHWDAIEISSEIPEKEQFRVYQKGTLGDLLPPERLEELAREDAPLPGKIALFSGTLATLGGIVHAREFRMTLSDPVLSRSVRFGYTVAVLPDRS
ncbi:MAG: DUF2848 domain-containing protein [Synergistaceae bacterium]|jgi:hypothetical protein|nr:DUF2848 domain-containing protein [Synergistaceae bacterium]